MLNRKTIAIVLLVPFLLLTAYAIQQVGYWGIFEAFLHNPGSWQVGADLVISLLLLWTFLFVDAKRTGRNPWPWFIATLFLGSIGPLLYLALGAKKDAEFSV